MHALGVLPLFDAGSIPNSLIVDGRRRCFLVRALAHPDDRVSQAAAHALQRVVIHHAQLRVKVLRALLALVGRIPPADVAVLATVLGHFTFLIEAWVDQLDQLDAFNAANASMLEPVEPYLATMESEALIAMGHAHASVRMPALRLLKSARSLGRALHECHERMVAVITGEVQDRARRKAWEERRDELERDEAALKEQRRAAWEARRGSRAERRDSTASVGLTARSNGTNTDRRDESPGTDGWTRRSGGGAGTARSLGGLSATTARSNETEITTQSGPRTEAKGVLGAGGVWGDATARSSTRGDGDDFMDALSGITEMSAEMQELRLVRAALVDDDRGAGPSSKRVFGARVADVIDEKWDEIRAAAAHKLLCASGDYMLDADKYRLPPQSQRVGSQPPQLTPRISPAAGTGCRPTSRSRARAATTTRCSGCTS